MNEGMGKEKIQGQKDGKRLWALYYRRRESSRLPVNERKLSCMGLAEMIGHLQDKL